MERIELVRSWVNRLFRPDGNSVGMQGRRSEQKCLRYASAAVVSLAKKARVRLWRGRAARVKLTLLGQGRVECQDPERLVPGQEDDVPSREQPEHGLVVR